MNNAWKNYRRMSRDGSIIWVHVTVIQSYRKLGYKLMKRYPITKVKKVAPVFAVK